MLHSFAVFIVKLKKIVYFKILKKVIILYEKANNCILLRTFYFVSYFLIRSDNI